LGTNLIETVNSKKKMVPARWRNMREVLKVLEKVYILDDEKYFTLGGQL
jgi:hypothetical protein